MIFFFILYFLPSWNPPSLCVPKHENEGKYQVLNVILTYKGYSDFGS